MKGNYDVFTNDAFAELFTWIYGDFIVFAWCFCGEVQGDDDEVKPAVPAALVSDLSGLVKSLQSLKAVHLRYIESKAAGVFSGGDQKLALLDGGATHGLRRGLPHELEGAEMVTVELVHGSTSLFRKAGCSTLLAKEEVEPIIPVRQLTEAGYQLKWSSSEVSIWHPQKGSIKCWRRQG